MKVTDGEGNVADVLRTYLVHTDDDALGVDKGTTLYLVSIGSSGMFALYDPDLDAMLVVEPWEIAKVASITWEAP